MPYFGHVSTKEHHALQLILQLARSYNEGRPVSLTKVSVQERISLKYLEQIIMPFRRAGWLKSVRGRMGGYRLMKNPHEISVRDVIQVIDGEQKTVFCLSEKKDRSCILEPHCSGKNAWQTIQKALDASMEKIKIDELIAHEKE